MNTNINLKVCKLCKKLPDTTCGVTLCYDCAISTGSEAQWNRIMDTSVEDKLRAELLRKTEQLERIKECYYGIDDAATSGDMIDLVFGIRKLKGML